MVDYCGSAPVSLWRQTPRVAAIRSNVPRSAQGVGMYKLAIAVSPQVATGRASCGIASSRIPRQCVSFECTSCRSSVQCGLLWVCTRESVASDTQQESLRYARMMSQVHSALPLECTNNNCRQSGGNRESEPRDSKQPHRHTPGSAFECTSCRQSVQRVYTRESVAVSGPIGSTYGK